MLVGLSMGAMLHAASFSLVQEGKPVSAIVVNRWSDQMEALAAVQLRDYVLRMTGAELPILTMAYDHQFLATWKPGDTLPEVAPYGELRPIFVTWDTALAEEEYHLTVMSECIRIRGGSAYGLLYGVDELLERLGVCLARPERLWWNLPHVQTLALPTCEVTSTPFFRLRGVHHHQSDHSLFAWMGFNRLNYHLQNPPGWYDTGMMAYDGVRPFFISHSWHFWVPRKVLHDHLDWNPVINGERKAIEAEGDEDLIHYQLCISNPELRKYFIDRVLEYLKNNPQMPIVPLETNDGHGYCECEACRAYGATASDQFFRFVAEAATEIQKQFPRVTVLCLSYPPHDELPNVELPSNVGVGVVSNNRNYARPLTDPSNQRYYDILVKWATALPGRVYIYELWAKEMFEGYPHPFAAVYAEDIKLYQKLQLAGLCPEGLHPSPFQEYLRGKLAWNPELDWKKILKEFCDKMFGKAASAMEQYYVLLENRMVEYGQNLKDLTTLSEFVRPIDAAAMKLLEQAAAQAEPGLAVSRVAAEREEFMKLHRTMEQWMPCKADVVTDAMRAANLLPNGDFEQEWKDVSHDTRWGEYKFEIVDGQAYHGRKCGCTTVITQGWARFILNAKGLDTSKKYALYCAVKCLDGAEAGNFWFIPGGMPAQLYTLGNTHGEWYRAVFHNIEIKEDNFTVLPTVHAVPSKGRILWDDIILLPEVD